MDDERGRALALLEAAHQFPVAYEVSVITLTADETFAAVRAAAEHGLEQPLGTEDHQMVPSKAGKYTSHRLRVYCNGPEDVLALLERLRAVAGVMHLL